MVIPERGRSPETERSLFSRRLPSVLAPADREGRRFLAEVSFGEEDGI